MTEKQLEHLSEEYKLIQSKIDGIGEFKFKVRGWMITIHSALLAALVTGKIPYPFDYFIIGIPFIFQLLEREQAEIQSILSERARNVEKAILNHSFPRADNEKKKAAIERAILNELQGSPRVAVLLHNGSRRNIWQLMKGMLNFNQNKLYYVLYIITLAVLIIKTCRDGIITNCAA